MIVVIGIADGQEMLAFFGEQEQGRDQDRSQNPAVHLLAVFDQVDLFVWNPPTRLLGVENQELLIDRRDCSRTTLRNVGNSPTHVFRMAPVASRRSRADQ